MITLSVGAQAFFEIGQISGRGGCYEEYTLAVIFM